MKEKEVQKTTGQDNASTKEEEENVQLEAVGSWRGSMNTTLLGMGMTSSAKIAIIEGHNPYGYQEKADQLDTSTSPKKRRHYSEKDSQESERQLRLWKLDNSLK